MFDCSLSLLAGHPHSWECYSWCRLLHGGYPTGLLCISCCTETPPELLPHCALVATVPTFVGPRTGAIREATLCTIGSPDRPITMSSAMCLLRVLLLGALLCPGRGNIREEIFTRPGSDLLIPIRHHVTLNHPDTSMCDRIEWKYKHPTRTYEEIIFTHRTCTLTKYKTFPNMKISENGSLIISNVTPENDGIYIVTIDISTGGPKQTDKYRVHVEVPVSVPVLNVSCLQNGSAEISCRVEEGTKPNIHLSVIGGSQENYSTSANNITAIVGSPGPWNITCSAKNNVSRSEKNRTGVTCPVPLSNIAVTSSCLLDGSAEAECSVKGSDPRYSWSLDGRFVSSHSRVTLPPPVSGTLHCDVTNEINHLSRSINIFCAVPVSDPVLDVTCLQNGSAEISCGVENGTDPSIYLTVSGELEVYNVPRSERTVRVTVPPVLPPDSWNISCSVKNNISERSTNRSHEACLVPVSDPVLDVTCLLNGSAEISCGVENGTDPSIYLTVNGEQKVDNVTRSERTVRVTVPPVSPPDSWNISCSVKNDISERSTNRSHEACPDPLSAPRINVSCHIDGSASVSCVVEKNQDVSYTWTVNGQLLYGNNSCTITFMNEEFISGPLNVSCSVNNLVSMKESNKTQIFCQAPHSTPKVMFYCQKNESVSVFCVVKEDQNVTYNWTVNGKLYQGSHSRNITFTKQDLTNATMNVSCSAQNSVSMKESNITQISCPDNTCLQCWQNALIGGFVALLVTMPPIFIAHWYILRGIRRNRRPSPCKTR